MSKVKKYIDEDHQNMNDIFDYIKDKINEIMENHKTSLLLKIK